MGPDPQTGGGTWRINVTGRILDSNGTGYDASAWVHVNPVTGAGRIFAAG
jgi:hypothetical protein